MSSLMGGYSIAMYEEGVLSAIGQGELNFIGPDVTVAPVPGDPDRSTVTIAGAAAVSGWTHTHPVVHLTDIADTVAIGAAAMSGGGEKVRIVGNTRLEGDTVITGSLTVIGNPTEIQSTVVNVTDRMVHYNATTGVVAVPAAMTGMAIDRGATAGPVDRSTAVLAWLNDSDVVDPSAGTGYWRFCTNTNGDDATVGADLDVRLRALTTSGGITIGAASAAAGADSNPLRLVGNVVGPAARNIDLLNEADAGADTYRWVLKNNGAAQMLAVESTGQFRANSGAVGTPTYSWQSYQTTGFYAAAGPLVSLAIAGAEAVRFGAGNSYFYLDNASIAPPVLTLEHTHSAGVGAPGDLAGQIDFYQETDAGVRFLAGQIQVGSDSVAAAGPTSQLTTFLQASGAAQTASVQSYGTMVYYLNNAAVVGPVLRLQHTRTGAVAGLDNDEAGAIEFYVANDDGGVFPGVGVPVRFAKIVGVATDTRSNSKDSKVDVYAYLADAESVAASVIGGGGITFPERASPGTPGAGFGTYWVLTGAPALPYFTDDAGADNRLAYHGSGGTLDTCYDFGGAGAGRTITADTGAVVINNFVADASYGLEIYRQAGVSTGTAIYLGLNAAAGAGVGSGQIRFQSQTSAALRKMDLGMEADVGTDTCRLMVRNNGGTEILRLTSGGNLSAVGFVQSVNGTATGPGHTFSGSTSDGLYWPGAGSVSVATGGVQSANFATGVSTLYYANDAAPGPTLELRHTRTGAGIDGDYAAYIDFYSDDSASAAVRTGRIASKVTTALTGATNSANLEFYARGNGSERLLFRASGGGNTYTTLTADWNNAIQIATTAALESGNGIFAVAGGFGGTANTYFLVTDTGEMRCQRRLATASGPSLNLKHDRAGSAGVDGDAAGIIGFYTMDSAAASQEFAQIKAVAVDADVGTGLDGAIDLSFLTGGTFGRAARIYGNGAAAEQGLKIDSAVAVGATVPFAFTASAGDFTTNKIFTVGDTVEAFAVNGNGQIIQGLGNVTLPVFSFAGDPDTGVYQAATGQIDFACDGALRATINAAGIVTAATYTNATYNYTTYTNAIAENTGAITFTVPNTVTFTNQNDSTTGVALQLYHNSPTPAATPDVIAALQFYGNDSTLVKTQYGEIQCATTNVTDTTEIGAIIHKVAGNGTLYEALRTQGVAAAAGIGFLGAGASIRQTGGENVTNSVTDSGSTAGTIPDITDGTTYASDYTNLRRALFQLARMLKQDHDALRLYGLLS